MTKNIVGLTTDDVVHSRTKYGSNILLKEKSKGFLGRFLENLNDPIIKILILALVVEVVFTFGKCNLFEVLGIVIAILIATTVSTASELGSERAFLKMQEETLHGVVKSLRNNQFSEISIAEVVVGDVLYISSGETVCADGIVLEGVIKVDQSALNGESREVTKAYSKLDEGWDLSSKGKVFRGSIVTNGNAVMKVCRVGAQTYYGMVARDVQMETRESPLKVRLSRLAQQISRIGYVMAAIVAIVYLFNVFFVDNNFSYNKIVESFQDLSLVFSSVTAPLGQL